MVSKNYSQSYEFYLSKINSSCQEEKCLKTRHIFSPMRGQSTGPGLCGPLSLAPEGESVREGVIPGGGAIYAARYAKKMMKRPRNQTR